MFELPFVPLFNENVDHRKELLLILKNAQQFINKCKDEPPSDYTIAKLRRWGITFKERIELGIEIDDEENSI